MKIGILTYHATHNYGAFLQAYALCNALIEKTGNEVEIINFSMKKAENENLRISKNYEHSIRKKKYLATRYSMFETSSVRYHKLSGERLNSDNLEDFSRFIYGKYDAIVVGSDEIWALNGYRGFPTPYWLPGITGCRKLSYAASSRSEVQSQSSETLEQVRSFLSSFEYIGVRDNPTKNLIESVALEDANIHINCDPTFVYDFHTSKEVGRHLIKDRFGVKGEKKCIALMLNSADLAESVIKTYGNQFDFISLFNYYSGTKGFVVLDPFEWMEAIAGADGLITDFFHGMVFALKNNTPFISFEARHISGKEYSKAYDLLHRNGLDSHFFMKDNPNEQTLRDVGSFLAGIISGKVESDFRQACENEKKLFSSFVAQFPDLRPNHIVIAHKGDCCGCRACEYVCPKKAITMKTDAEGFWYPAIDHNKCVNCGLCKKSCTFNVNWGGIKESVSEKPLDVYGIKHKSEEIRLASRSGGIFTALTDQILDHNGAVYGVSLNSEFLAEHKRAQTRAERDQFRGSKYIQSDMGDVYLEIREDLRAGREVLFSGTPCQVAAVRKAMEGENCKNLYLVDIICHGVPSPKIWRDYLDYQEKKLGGKVTSVDFRNKKFGWADHKESFTINGKEYDSRVFTELFYSHRVLRPSCYNCKYKCVSRISDITIADYWGIEKAIPGFNDDKGVSLVLVNTPKGKTLFEAGKECTICMEARLEDSMQNSLRFCYPEPAGRKRFWEVYQKQGMSGYLRQVNRDKKTERRLNLYGKGKRFTKRVLRCLWRIVH